VQRRTAAPSLALFVVVVGERIGDGVTAREKAMKSKQMRVPLQKKRTNK
jgi:hypothetical protein